MRTHIGLTRLKPAKHIQYNPLTSVFDPPSIRRESFNNKAVNLWELRAPAYLSVHVIRDALFAIIRVLPPSSTLFHAISCRGEGAVFSATDH